MNNVTQVITLFLIIMQCALCLQTLHSSRENTGTAYIIKLIFKILSLHFIFVVIHVLINFSGVTKTTKKKFVKSLILNNSNSTEKYHYVIPKISKGIYTYKSVFF